MRSELLFQNLSALKKLLEGGEPATGEEGVETEDGKEKEEEVAKEGIEEEEEVEKEEEDGDPLEGTGVFIVYARFWSMLAGGRT